MRYTEIQSKSDKDFKRLTGVTLKIFSLMLQCVEQYKKEHRKCAARGRPLSTSDADKLLIMLMYYREYRTFFHISQTYGISEMHCWRIVTGMEKILLASKKFHLPGKKSLRDNSHEVTVVDVSEHPAERPKKNSGGIIRAKRNAIPSKVR
jgi:hypothetical protein